MSNWPCLNIRHGGPQSYWIWGKIWFHKLKGHNILSWKWHLKFYFTLFGPKIKAYEKIWHTRHVWRPFWIFTQICFHHQNGHPKYSWKSHFKCFPMLFGTQTMHVCTLAKQTHTHWTSGLAWQPCWIWGEIWFRQINGHPWYSRKWHLEFFTALFGGQTRDNCTLHMVNWRPSWI